MSRSEFTALRASFQKEMEDMKASIMATIGEALQGPSRRQDAEGDTPIYDVEDEDGSDDGLDSEEEAALINSILKNQAAAKDPTALVEQPTPTSEVMGAEYLEKSCNIGSIRDGKIVAAQAQMSSPDKKRTCCMVMMLEFLHSDLAATLAKSVLMFPYERVLKLGQMKDQELAAGLWREEQLLVKKGLEDLKGQIAKEKAHLYLANDKSLNKHGYATIDHMEKMEELEKFTSEEQREAFKVAAAQMDRIQGQQQANKKRKRPGKGRGAGAGKPESKKKPYFVKCAACGRNGHLEGDAKCAKAAEKK